MPDKRMARGAELDALIRQKLGGWGMSSEWFSTTIGELVSSGEATIQTGPFGSQLHKHDYVEVGTPVIPTEAIGRGRILDIEVPQVSAEKAIELARHRLHVGDILFARRGAQATGLSAIVDERFEGGLCGTGAILLRVRSARVLPHYLAMYLSSEFAFQWLRTHAVGAVMPNLNTEIIKALPLTLPPIAEQRELSLMLGALDDRITLLRETNATLEAIAQALFKSWFVDFDPVRAKAEGRTPDGMDEATAALFPDSLEETELGLVPKGWRVGRLDDLLVLQRGFDLPSQDRVPGQYPIIAASGPSGTHQEAMVRGPGVVTGRSGVLGKVFLELEDFWPLNTTLWVKDFKAVTPSFAYELLRMLDFKSYNAGSAVPTLNRNHIHGLPYVVPDRRCVERYESLALPIHQRCNENEKLVQTLSTLRDTLLPRLISGQLRLPEANALLEGVA
jgi:type I restriction enzyme, S subunit